MLRIAVIVLHYGSLSDTLECLSSLIAQDYLHYEILLVDNGSGDPELEKAVQSYPDLHLIRNQSNLGYAEGNNVGIRAALERGASAVLLLNNDTVVSSDLLSAFANAAVSYPDAGAFGAKILFYDQPTVIWHAGGTVTPQTFLCYHEGWRDTEEKWNEVRSILYGCGCALFVKRETIEKVGLLAPEFFLLWEEIDWCWRIRRANDLCLFVPEAKVWHKISRGMQGGIRDPLWHYYYFRNRLLFLKKNVPLNRRLRFYLFQFPRELAQITLRSFLPKESKANRYALKGIFHYFSGRFFSI